MRQALQVAVFIEQEGERFYRDLAAASQDEKIKAMCLKLAEDELAHRKIFEKSLGHWRTLHSKEENIKAYLKKLNLQGLFSSPAYLNASLEDLIENAVGYEKKTIEFYKSIENDFPETWKRMHIENIILLEKEHVDHLSLLKPKSINSSE